MHNVECRMFIDPCMVFPSDGLTAILSELHWIATTRPLWASGRPVRISRHISHVNMSASSTCPNATRLESNTSNVVRTGWFFVRSGFHFINNIIIIINNNNNNSNCASGIQQFMELKSASKHPFRPLWFVPAICWSRWPRLATLVPRGKITLYHHYVDPCIYKHVLHICR